jgi:hypothetical protein
MAHKPRLCFQAKTLLIRAIHGNNAPAIAPVPIRSSQGHVWAGRPLREILGPPPPVVQERRERAAKARRNRWVSSERLSHHKPVVRLSAEARRCGACLEERQQ